MPWRTEIADLLVGPLGVMINGRVVVPPPLTMEGLALALREIPADACRHVRVAVDDAWCRTLLQAIPRGVRQGQEVQGLITHHMRDLFGPNFAVAPRSLAARTAYPWGLSIIGHGQYRLVAACPGSVCDVIRGWIKSTDRRLIGLGSDWGNSAANLPRASSGGLAIYRGNRMTVGAWSKRGWCGWRSFVAANAIEAQQELLGWLNGLSWHEDSVVVWNQGWQPDLNSAQRFMFRQLPAARSSWRPQMFDFNAACDGRLKWSARQKIVFSSALLTLLAAMWVSRPEGELIDGSEIVSAVRRVNSEQKIASSIPDQAPINVASGASEIQEVVIWPTILGVFEHEGKRRVLYTTASDSDSVPMGGMIDRRFRVGRISNTNVIVTDLQTGEQREIELGASGVQP